MQAGRCGWVARERQLVLRAGQNCFAVMTWRAASDMRVFMASSVVAPRRGLSNGSHRRLGIATPIEAAKMRETPDRSPIDSLAFF